MHRNLTLVLVAVAVAGAGCMSAPAPIKNAIATPDGNLVLKVRYTSLCATPNSSNQCVSISYPQVCWTGTCASQCTGVGARSFQVCAPGGTRTDDPMLIEQSTEASHLMPGSWQLHGISPKWNLTCTVPVYASKTSFSIIDSEQETCRSSAP